MDRSSVALVIPALNESSTIAGVVAAAAKYGVPIVIDDGSTDNTAELARQAGGVVISHDRNLGYDAALNSGFKKASEMGCQIIITLDADGQHDPTLLQKFIDKINLGADIVLGVRNKFQRFAEHIFSWYSRGRYGIKDPLCGMKAYRTKVYCDLGYFDSYNSIGTELVLFAAKNEYILDEVSFIVRKRIGSSRFGPIFIGNYKIFRAIMFSIFKN